MGGSSSTISNSATRINALQIQSSASGKPIAWIAGRNRISPNLIYYSDFEAVAKTTTKKSGGKGGGGATQKDTTYTYYAAIILAVGRGPLGAIHRVFRDKEVFSSLAQIGLNYANGTHDQTVWGFLQTRHPAEAIAYADTAYVFSSRYLLNDNAGVQNHTFEVDGRYQVPGLPDGRMALGCRVDGSLVGKFMLRDGTVDRSTLKLDLDGFIAKALDPQSGYAWAVIDTLGRIGLALRVDGTVTGKFLLGTGAVPRKALGADLSGFIAVQLSPESGYVWAVVDAVGRIALGITTAGKTVGNFDIHIPDVTGIEYLKPVHDLLCAGDSLTANSSQVSWREQLAPLISARTIVNGGIGGQTSRQIAARFGAGTALVTVTDNQIPASGSVTVTALSTLLLSTPATNSGTFTLTGTLGGIHGTLTCTHSETGDSSDVYTFARDAAGDARYSAPKSPFVPDVPGDGFYTEIIWMGRNNLDNIEQIKADIRAMVVVQKTVEKRYLIITPPLGGNPTPGTSTGEGIGTATYNNCVALEDWATAEYGDRVIKIREWLMQFNDGSADDLDDVAKGVVPRSLRLDIIHNTTISNGHIARRIAYEINRRSW